MRKLCTSDTRKVHCKTLAQDDDAIQLGLMMLHILKIWVIQLFSIVVCIIIFIGAFVPAGILWLIASHSFRYHHIVKNNAALLETYLGFPKHLSFE
jgi:hypothetical protein